MGKHDELWENVPQKILQQDFLDIVTDLSRLRAHSKDDKVAEHFFERLNIALENAVSCVFLAQMGLVIPLVTITRSIFESMISIYWASLSEQNVEVIMNAEKFELMRLMKNNLTNGRAVITDIKTGVDETERVLNHPDVQKAKRPPKFDKMADESGIRNIYDMFYGFLSMFAHGHATKLSIEQLYDAAQSKEENKHITAIMPLMHGCLKSIYLITVNSIVNKRKTKKEEIESILRAKLTI